jgi:hypothetical protein
MSVLYRCILLQLHMVCRVYNGIFCNSYRRYVGSIEVYSVSNKEYVGSVPVYSLIFTYGMSCIFCNSYLRYVGSVPVYFVTVTYGMSVLYLYIL